MTPPTFAIYQKYIAGGLNMLTDIEINSLLDTLTLDEMIGQMLCYNLTDDMEKAEQWVKETKAGSFFVAGFSAEKIKEANDILNKYSKIPGMIAADVELGVGHVVPGETRLPHPMAWGACDDADLVEKAHQATAERCRQLGIHWTFSPIVDINFNKDNPVTNIRAISDVPKQVAKIGTAAIRGLQKNGMLAAGCKHFPGDGVDDRNQHFCTTVNSLSKEEWMDTFGYVYKEMFKAGTATVMVAHIALPSYDEKYNDWIGYLPACLSYNLLTKLLKEELGFTGCVVSDALSMIGAAACVPYDRLAIEFVKAGGDMLLFPKPEYFEQIKSAVLSGEISMERIKDAARRVLILKNKARLFEPQENVLSEITVSDKVAEYAEQIAEKSLCVVRDYDNVLPMKLNKGDKILILNIKKNKEKETMFYACDLDTVENELKNRGFQVVSYTNASRADFAKDLTDCAAVLVNCKISSQDYVGGTLRVMWDHIAPFWRGEVLKHPKMVFTSFGDPYKIYDFPYLKTYVNAFSYSEATQRAFVKALLGEISFAGKSPVGLEGFFNGEV